MFVNFCKRPSQPNRVVIPAQLSFALIYGFGAGPIHDEEGEGKRFSSGLFDLTHVASS
jgi:hypothetical protein